MLNQSNIVYLVIWAIAIGLACAFIYTNTQRTALSVFINALIKACAYDENSAIGLSSMGLGKLQRRIVRNACIKHFGLKRIIVTTSEQSQDESDEFSNMFGKKKAFRYYLNTTQTQEILKKYSFKSMPLYQIFLFTIALLVTAFLLTKAYDIFYDYAYIPEFQEENDIEKELEESSKPQKEPYEQDLNDSHIDQNDAENKDVITDKPTIPTMPTIPTLP